MVQNAVGSYYRTMMYRTTELYLRARTALRDAFHGDDGASMVEYAMLIALIAMVAFAAVTLVGDALNSKYDSIASSVVES
jgi:pilus assembly protein Flp/PilA